MASNPKPQDFTLALVNGNVKAAMSAAGAISSDIWKVPRASIRVIPGLNPRNPDDPEYKAHIRLLADSMKANGFYPNKPLTGFVGRENDEDVINLTDGHSRLLAFDLAVSEGFQGETLPFVVKPRGTNLEDLTISLVMDNSGKAFTPYELSIICKRLVNAGMEEKEIARRLGKTTTYVRDLLDLQAAPAQVRQMVATGQVSATTARKTVREHGAKAQEVLEHAAKAAKSKGKAKLTEKHIRAAAGSSPSITTGSGDQKATAPLDLRNFLRDLQDFSVSAHGSAPQAEQLIEDLTDLLQDLAVAPAAEGWLVAATMAFDGALRSGSTPEEIHTALRHAPALFAVMKALRANTASPSDPTPAREADALNAEDHV